MEGRRDHLLSLTLSPMINCCVVFIPEPFSLSPLSNGLLLHCFYQRHLSLSPISPSLEEVDDGDSFGTDGDESFVMAAAAALEIDENNPSARRNTLGDSGPFWAFSEPGGSPWSCPDPSASIASCIVSICGVSACVGLLFGRHGGRDGIWKIWKSGKSKIRKCFVGRPRPQNFGKKSDFPDLEQIWNISGTKIFGKKERKREKNDLRQAPSSY